MRPILTLLIFTEIIIAFSCTAARNSENKKPFNRLTFLGEYDIPYNMQFQNTIVGGLSGIDYDKENDVYYIISDDRSEKNPARFYKVQIFINNEKIDSVAFIETIFLKNKNGSFYPGISVDPNQTPDPEAIRYNHLKNSFVWSSEGERIVRADKTVLEDPAIIEITGSGNYIDSFILPAQLHMSKEEKGPRRNGAFEGLTFSNNYKSLFVSMEEPLYNDGLRAGLHDTTGIIRIIKLDVATKKPVAQYAYTIDGVAHPPYFPGAFVINGVSDILSVGENKLIVVERSYSTGRLSSTIKIYLADLHSAQNIEKNGSLKIDPVKRMVVKRLLLNMDDLGIYIDNIEGVCFGPNLPDGHKTLIFVSDNNFAAIQKTQFLLFKIE
ncbi:MAG: esterase-like activity of phytase family protein [Ginsengibacter sp.]